MLEKSLQYKNSNFLSHPFKATTYLSETGNILEVLDFMQGVTWLLKTEHQSAVITIQVKLKTRELYFTHFMLLN